MTNANMMNDDLITFHSQKKFQDFRRAALWTWIHRKLKDGRVIDVGGGSGYMTRCLLEAGYDTVLAEPDETLFDFSREHSASENQSLEIIRVAAEQLDASEIGLFTNILCLDVLEHIEDDTAALNNLTGLLTSDGRIIISVPAVPYLYGKRDVLYGHYRRYSPAALKQLVTSCGLEIEEFGYWNLLGVAPYFFYEKVLRKPINDTLRRKKGNLLANFTRKTLYIWLKGELFLPLPLGLSLLLTARKPIIE